MAIQWGSLRFYSLKFGGPEKGRFFRRNNRRFTCCCWCLFYENFGSVSLYIMVMKTTTFSIKHNLRWLFSRFAFAFVLGISFTACTLSCFDFTFFGLSSSFSKVDIFKLIAAINLIHINILKVPCIAREEIRNNEIEMLAFELHNSDITWEVVRHQETTEEKLVTNVCFLWEEEE